MKGRPFRHRLGFALAGIRVAFRGEASFRFQALGGALALGFLALTGAEPVWWAAFILASAFVLAAELFNTALEALADVTHPEVHPAIGRAKDIAAGAVLVASGAAVGVFLAFVASRLNLPG